MKLWSKGLEGPDGLWVSITGHRYEVFFSADVDSRRMWMDNGQLPAD
jgi:hypothetical protein